MKERRMKASEGLVFDIQRFSVHDGPGLRTTVFLKGCPLRCRWCQNPEGLETRRRPVWMEKRCIHCQSCIGSSPAVTWDSNRDRPLFSPQSDDFEKAVTICPAAAITWDSSWYTPDALMKQIEKDRVFFRENGGVTFSGGEPFRQAEFLLEILKRVKEAGIHTALETSLFTDLKNVQAAAPLVDHFFFDLKVLDEKRHQELTGVSNESILRNAAWLLNSRWKDRLVVRTPLIPGCTATDENIRAIGEFLFENCPDVRWELLNYNPLAGAKYDLAEKVYPLEGKGRRFTTQEMDHFYEVAGAAGIRNLIREH